MTDSGKSSDDISLEDIDAWAGGTASPETEALVNKSLDDPNSHASQYLDWQKNPPAFVREHGGPPALVAQRLANLSPETRKALRHMNDDLPSEGHFGEIEDKPKRAKKRPATPRSRKPRPSADDPEQGPERFIGGSDDSPDTPEASR
jgi:hypothetical protein